MPSNSLTAIYDLRVCPETFDIVDFISLAVNEAHLRQFDRIDFVLYVPKDEHRKYARRFASTVSNLRIRNLLLQCLSALKSKLHHDLVLIQNAKHLQDYLLEKPVESYFPSDYTIASPTCRHNVHHFVRLKNLPEIDCFDFQMERARSWLRETGLNPEKLVTLTLRESKIYPERNVDTDNWLEAAIQLKRFGWDTLIIRDTARAFEPLASDANLICCPQASLNIPFRAALYRLSRLNVQITGGPSTLCIANPHCAFLYLFKIENACGAVSHKGLMQDAFLPGSTWPDASENRCTFWETTPPDALLGSIRFVLYKQSDTVCALTQSGLKMLRQPFQQSELDERTTLLVKNGRSEEAALTRIHFLTNGSYRETNLALALLWTGLSQTDILFLATPQQTESANRSHPLALPFLEPTSQRAWKNALEYLFDKRQFAFARKLTQKLHEQSPILTEFILAAWNDKLNTCLESGELGTALENAIFLSNEICSTLTKALKHTILQRLKDNRNLSVFIDTIGSKKSDLLTNFQQISDTQVPANNKLILYGTGSGGKTGLAHARKLNLRPYAFCQTSPPPQDTFENIKLLSVEQTLSIKDSIYLVCSQSFAADMAINLVANGIRPNRVYLCFPSV